MEIFCERTDYIMVQKLVRTKKLIKVGKICGKDDILNVQEKQVTLIGSKKKRSLEMNPRKREL